jgi:hypothetical protein
MTEPARLLAGRRRLSRLEKEAVLERVLAQVAPRVRWRRRLAVGALAVAAATAGALVLVPRAPREDLTARGGELPPGFEVTCVPAPCTAGSKLVFDVTSVGDSTGGIAYFAALGRRGDTLIWYFPSTANGHSLPVPHGGGVLDTGFVLGPEHAPGTYAIEGVFSPVPLDRAAIRAILERGGATVTRQVVVQ